MTEKYSNILDDTNGKLAAMYIYQGIYHSSLDSNLVMKVGQPWIKNLQMMWTGKWVRSRCTQD